LASASPPPISGLSLEEKPITLYSGSVKPLRVLHHRWRVQRVLKLSWLADFPAMLPKGTAGIARRDSSSPRL
ncbi:MAG: hypothetical protein ACYTKD_13120, partial [Planctomycetota bacterium]